MFLQHAKKSSECDRQCQLIELVNDPSAQRVTFYIQQRYKYRLDGEAVVFNDHILLYNQKYNCYLHVSEEHLQDQITIENFPSKYRPRSPKRRQNPDEFFKKLEANCSQNFYKWQVVNYRQQKPKDVNKFIYSGDVIRLKHAETGGYLCYDDLSKKKPGNPAYVRIFKGQDLNDQKTTNNLFEIEAHDDLKQETMQNNGMLLEWRMRGVVSFSQVRFRHLNSGQPLALRMMEVKDKKGTKGGKQKKQLVVTLAENMAKDEINQRLDKIDEIEHENRFNSDFNKDTDPKIMSLSRGVDNDQVFEIENTITEPVQYVKNLSVLKINNRSFNNQTQQFEQMTVSTEIKRLEGDEQADEEEEQDPASNLNGSQDPESVLLGGDLTPEQAVESILSRGRNLFTTTRWLRKQRKKIMRAIQTSTLL